MTSEDECAGCAKVRRHPGEGYSCAVHPNLNAFTVQVPIALFEEAVADGRVKLVESDQSRFGVASHDLVTIIEQPTGWRLWCMRCGLKGETLYEDARDASDVAAQLRSVSTGVTTVHPRCSR